MLPKIFEMRDAKIIVIFKKSVKWGYCEKIGKDKYTIVLGENLKTNDFILMMVHELIHIFWGWEHNATTEKMGFRSTWKRWEDRDVMSERLVRVMLKGSNTIHWSE